MVDLGALKALGLIKVQTTMSVTGMTKYHPIQTLLQMAIANRIMMGIRVQALQGFEWRIQLVLSNLNILANFSEKDMEVFILKIRNLEM